MITSDLNTKGYFFLSELPDKKCYGNLIIKGNDISLELLDGLADLELNQTGTRHVFAHGNKPEYQKVFGLTSEGSIVLLKNHFGRSMKFKYLSETKESFFMAFVSEEDLTENQELEFEEINIKYIRLKDFVNIRSVNPSITYDESTKKPLEFTVRAELSKKAYFIVKTSKYKISFEPSFTYSLMTDDPISHKFPLNEFITLKVKKNSGKFNKDEVVDIVYSLRNFIGFALRDAIYPTEVICRNSANKEEIEKLGKKYLDTKVYFHEREYLPIEKSKNYDFLFLATDLGNDLGKYIEKWIDSQKKYPILHKNYFTYLYIDKAIWESIVLTLIIGIEDYIEKELKKEIIEEKNKVVNKDEIKAVKKQLTRLKDSKLKEFILEKIGYFSSDVSFVEKLSAIRKVLPEYLSQKLSDDDITLIKDIRNKIAHGNVPSDLYKKAENQEIVWKLVRINEICLMTSIGFNAEMINKFISKYY
jgi:hypothetical protein